MLHEDDALVARDEDRKRLLAACAQGAELISRSSGLAPLGVLVEPGLLSLGFDAFAWADRQASIDRLAAVTGAAPGWKTVAEPSGGGEPDAVDGSAVLRVRTYGLGAELAADVRLVAIAYPQEDGEPDAPAGGRCTSTGSLVTPLLDIAVWVRGLDPRLRVGSVALHDNGEELAATVALDAAGHARSTLALVGAVDVEMDLEADSPALFGWVRLPSGHDVEVCVPAA